MPRSSRPQESLAIPDAELLNRLPLLLGLDPFGHNRGSQRIDHFDESAKGGRLQRVVRNALDELPIDFDHIGLEENEQLERRPAESDIVEGNADARTAQQAETLLQR